MGNAERTEQIPENKSASSVDGADPSPSPSPSHIQPPSTSADPPAIQPSSVEHDENNATRASEAENLSEPETNLEKQPIAELPLTTNEPNLEELDIRSKQTPGEQQAPPESADVGLTEEVKQSTNKYDNSDIEVQTNPRQETESVMISDEPMHTVDETESGEIPDEEGHPYVGKRVKIIQGPAKGRESVVNEVRHRGWWGLDGFEGLVHSRRCKLMDQVTQKEMEDYYAKRGMKFTGRPMATHTALASTSRRKGDLDDTTAEDKKRKHDEYKPVMLDDLLAKNPTEPSKVPRTQQPKKRRPCQMALPPILINQQFSESVRYLPEDYKVTVFNRKTGMIMRDAVLLKDLEGTLKRHGEYEPIVPSEMRNLGDGKRAQNFSRVGRSAFNVRVRETVSPQIREEIASYKDKAVYIKSGRHKGKVGTVETCVPGGWYLINGVLPNMSLAVTHSQIELIKEKVATQEAAKGGGSTKHEKGGQKSIANEKDEIKAQFRKVLLETTGSSAKALKQQVDALANEESSLKRELREEEAKGGKTSILKKKLTYILDCRKKAELDWKNSIRTSVVAAAAANKPF